MKKIYFLQSNYLILILLILLAISSTGQNIKKRARDIINHKLIHKDIKTLGEGINHWDPQFVNGTDDAILTIAEKKGNIYVGGMFTHAGGKPANHIAKWDGKEWSSLGEGVNGIVNTILIDGDTIYAAGFITSTDNEYDFYIAKWDGTSWTAISGYLNGLVNSITKIGNNLYVGGLFSAVGGIGANNIACWDGKNWHALANGTDNMIWTLASDGTNLYAGGEFEYANNKKVNYIAMWDGFDWNSLAGGVDGQVYTLNYSGNNLFVGGSFIKANNTICNNIARWDGSQWFPIGNGIDAIVNTILVTDINNIYAGSEINVLSKLGKGIEKWNGTTWETISKGVDAAVYSLLYFNNSLYLSGYFNRSGDNMLLQYICKYDGTNFCSLGNSVNSTIYAIAKSDTNLYVAGSFISAGNKVVNRIALWNGKTWASMGEGFNGTVKTIAVQDNNIYVGGSFTMSGQDSVKRVARWNGTKWVPVGGGFDADVNTLYFKDNILYAGGDFTEAGQNPVGFIAKWDGIQWSSLDFGFESSVNTINSIGNDIFAGGWFNRAWNVETPYIAKWDGNHWNNIGNPDGPVYATTVMNNKLFIGGAFKSIGTDSIFGIAMWDGNKWYPLDTKTKATINALYSYDNKIYAAGIFKTSDTITLNYIGVWDGQKWTAIESGTNDKVYAMLATNTDLYIGGDFTFTGDTPAHCFGRKGTAPFINGQTQKISKCVGENLLLQSNIDGSDPMSFQWYKDNQIIQGATSKNYILNNVQLSDSGYYYCSASNYLGNILSDSIYVKINNVPTVDAGNDITINNGDNTTITATGTGNFYWSTKETTSTITVSPTSTTIYTLTLTNQYGCTASDQIVVTVGNSICSVDVGKDTSICKGQIIKLNATGGATYLWNTGEKSPTITVSPSNTTKYEVTITLGSCTASNSITVTIMPTPIANAGNDQTIISGQSATLNATGGEKYTWSNNMSTATIIVSPELPTIYTVTVTLGSCSATDDVIVNIIEPCNIKVDAGKDTSITIGSHVILSANTINCNNCSFLWNNGLGTTQSIIVSPTITSTYYVKVRSGNCTAIDFVVVNVFNVGINNITADNNLNIYPVPANDLLYIEYPQQINSIYVYNSEGLLQYQENFKNINIKTINLQKLSSGLYYMKIDTNKSIIYKKFIKM